VLADVYSLRAPSTSFHATEQTSPPLDPDRHLDVPGFETRERPGSCQISLLYHCAMRSEVGLKGVPKGPGIFVEHPRKVVVEQRLLEGGESESERLGERCPWCPAQLTVVAPSPRREARVLNLAGKCSDMGVTSSDQVDDCCEHPLEISAGERREVSCRRYRIHSAVPVDQVDQPRMGRDARA